jgi:hypothetical protein
MNILFIVGYGLIGFGEKVLELNIIGEKMYIIKPKQDASVKFHIVSCPKIMEEVKSDLENRFGAMTVESIPDKNTYTWDPGGMVYFGEGVSPVVLDLGDLKFNVLGQHFDDLTSVIYDYKPRGNKEKYIKIYGKYNCLCLSIQQYDDLLVLLRDPQIILKARYDLQKAEDAINDLVKSEIIIKGVKDSSGKIYNEAPTVKPIDYKKLN